MRIGIAYETGGSWGEIARGLGSGFNAHSVEVALVPADLDRLAAKAVYLCSRHVRPLRGSEPPVVMLRSARVRRQQSRVGAVDVWVQMGGSFSPPRSAAFVTFEDMTVPLALRTLKYQTLGQRTRSSWLDRQAFAYTHAKRCYVASDWAAASVVADYGVRPEKISIVGLGRSYEPAVAASKKWADPVFLWVGYDWERKNGPGVVRAFHEVRKINPDATLHLVGGHPPILEPGVVTHGRLSRSIAPERALMRSLFATATCFVMPSRIEPFGIVYVEAGAAGTPSIGTLAGGARSAVGPGGICIDPDDQAALERSMMMMCDPATAEQFGDKARAHSSNFTWPRIAERMLSTLA